MGCSDSMLKVTDPSKDGEPPPHVDKTLEQEVAKEWAIELADLFALWDIDKSGHLEVTELGRVVAIYKGEPWDKWSQKERDHFVGNFMKWFDHYGTPDQKLSPEEFATYIVTEAVVRNPEDPDGSVGAVVTKYTNIIQETRIADLFAVWDMDDSGFLDASELNAVIAKFNDLDVEDWDKCGFPLSGEEKESLKSTKELIAKYDTEASDQKLSLVEFQKFVLDSTLSENPEAPGSEFNRTVTKFTEIITNLR